METAVSNIVWLQRSSVADVTCDKCDAQNFLMQHIDESLLICNRSHHACIWTLNLVQKLLDFVNGNSLHRNL